jgi:hypothetical protein
MTITKSQLLKLNLPHTALKNYANVIFLQNDAAKIQRKKLSPLATYKTEKNSVQHSNLGESRGVDTVETRAGQALRQHLKVDGRHSAELLPAIARRKNTFHPRLQKQDRRYGWRK